MLRAIAVVFILGLLCCQNFVQLRDGHMSNRCQTGKSDSYQDGQQNGFPHVFHLSKPVYIFLARSMARITALALLSDS